MRRPITVFIDTNKPVPGSIYRPGPYEGALGKPTHEFRIAQAIDQDEPVYGPSPLEGVFGKLLRMDKFGGNK